MKSSVRELSVPLYESTLRSLESDARRFNTTVHEIAAVILEKKRAAAFGVKKFTREAQCALCDFNPMIMGELNK